MKRHRQERDGPIGSVFGGKHSPIAREQAKQRTTDDKKAVVKEKGPKYVNNPVVDRLFSGLEAKYASEKAETREDQVEW